MNLSPRVSMAATALLAGALCCSSAASSYGAEAVDYAPAKKHFADAAADELARGVLPGFSVAWVVEGETVHAAGYGQADWQREIPADADTIYRAGSISKLFNAVAAMQLVEQDVLDLDAPIQKALPDFSVEVPFAKAGPITIRQMLCHRSGMVREAPVGGYLDPSEPTAAELVKSVAACALVNPPNTITRYSNVGPTIVGRALEVRTGTAFGDYQQEHVLGPLGMESSAWKMNSDLRPRLAKGRMRVACGDGSYDFEEAPEFELGILPAGNLYTTARDLARFAAFMMSAGGSDELSPPLVKPETLQTMYTPQLIDDATGFGLGFFVGEYRGHKTAQHGGAVYGFSTRLVVLPEEQIAVIVLSNCDIGSGRVTPLVELSLDLLLEAVRGEALPEPPQTVELSSDQLAPLAGEYESTSYWAHVKVDDEGLSANISGQPIRLVATAPDKFLADGRIMYRSPVEFERNEAGQVVAFTALSQRFERVDPENSPAVPASWKSFCGKYGPRFIPLVVSVRNGHLYGTVENEYDYRLQPVNRVTFNLPPGMYADEEVVFQTDAAGTVLGAIMANQYLPRHAE